MEFDYYEHLLQQKITKLQSQVERQDKRIKKLLAEAMPSLYHYRAELVRVIDGDTIVVDLDLGCSIWHRHLSIRLFGIDTPELRGSSAAQGQAAKEALEFMLINDSPLTIETIKDKTGKYGRLLGIIWTHGQQNVNELMIELGHAKRLLMER